MNTDQCAQCEIVMHCLAHMPASTDSSLMSMFVCEACRRQVVMVRIHLGVTNSRLGMTFIENRIKQFIVTKAPPCFKGRVIEGVGLKCPPCQGDETRIFLNKAHAMAAPVRLSASPKDN